MDQRFHHLGWASSAETMVSIVGQIVYSVWTRVFSTVRPYVSSVGTRVSSAGTRVSSVGTMVSSVGTMVSSVRTKVSPVLTKCHQFGQGFLYKLPLLQFTLLDQCFIIISKSTLLPIFSVNYCSRVINKGSPTASLTK